MTQDAILFFTTIPSMIWSLFSGFKIPGVNFSPGTLIFGILSFRVLIWVMTNVLGLGQNYLTNVGRSNNKKDD